MGIEGNWLGHCFRWVVWAGLPQEVLLGDKDEALGQQVIGMFVGGALEGQGEAGPEAST